MQELSISLSDEEMQTVEKEAERRGQSVDELVRDWIQELNPEQEDADFSFSAGPVGDVVNGTFASNPGRLEIQWTRFFRAYPRILIGFGAVIVALTALILFKSAWWVIVLAPVVWLLQRILSRIKVQFRSGDTNPGVIVSQEPPLIAVLTDLTQGRGSFPVVKILRQPLRACGLSGAEAGTRLATVSLYSGAVEGAPHWSDFDPVVVQAATEQDQTIRNRLDSIAAEQWEQLEAGLDSLLRRTPGVYPLSWQPKPGTLLDPGLGGNESKQG